MTIKRGANLSVAPVLASIAPGASPGANGWSFTPGIVRRRDRIICRTSSGDPVTCVPIGGGPICEAAQGGAGETPVPGRQASGIRQRKGIP